MLVLARKPGEEIRIGDHIKVVFIRFGQGSARIGIEAPPELPVHRLEVYRRIKEAAEDAKEKT